MGQVITTAVYLAIGTLYSVSHVSWNKQAHPLDVLAVAVSVAVCWPLWLAAELFA
jgi:hypothetical protein